jgi:hypothetical protein
VKRSAYRVSVAKPEGKRPISRPGHKLEHSEMDLRETEWKVGGLWTIFIWLRTETSGGLL